jgi:hypothetical protein
MPLSAHLDVPDLVFQQPANGTVAVSIQASIIVFILIAGFLIRCSMICVPPLSASSGHRKAASTRGGADVPSLRCALNGIIEPSRLQRRRCPAGTFRGGNIVDK